MFDEIDQVKEERKPIKTEEREELFKVEDISNKEIGSKIKDFSKIIYKIQVFIYVVFGIIMLIGTFMEIEELGGSIFLAIIIIAFIVFGLSALAYYLFLIISGFGALVEDVNAIKENKTSSSKKERKTPQKL